MFTLLLTVLFVLAGSLAQAATETKDAQHYGNCDVGTVVDLFTDEETYSLLCMEDPLVPGVSEPMILISAGSKPEDFYLLLSTGLQVHMEPRIPVALRIDKGPLLERDADWIPENGKNAYIFDQPLVRSLLQDLARGQRVVIRVGPQSAAIALHGSRQAVHDFKRRAGLQPQQTLEIPTH